MPRLSVWTIRAALVHLGLGFTFGALMLTNKGLPVAPVFWRLLPIHIEMLMVGWLIQLAMGVAFWILPRWNTSRGTVWPVTAGVIGLNTGILVIAGSAWFGWSPGWLIGRGLEMAAVIGFAIHIWPRVKPLGA
jgi:hypothetical protein